MRLLVHRLNDGTYDPGKDRTAAAAAKRIGEKTAERPRRSRIGTRSTPKEAAKKCPSSDTANRTANDLGQLIHRHVLQHRTDSLTAEDASNNLNDNGKYRFHVGIPLNARAPSSRQSILLAAHCEQSRSKNKPSTD